MWLKTIDFNWKSVKDIFYMVYIYTQHAEIINYIYIYSCNFQKIWAFSIWYSNLNEISFLRTIWDHVSRAVSHIFFSFKKFIIFMNAMEYKLKTNREYENEDHILHSSKYELIDEQTMLIIS